MNIIDYNGTGDWSFEAVIERYAVYARRFDVASPCDLSPRVHAEEETRWIYPVMDRVIECINAGDPACAEIGVEFIETSASFPFGRILKFNTARALRRAPLTNDQKDRIRKRVVEMLCTGYLPREFRQYAKLARKIGMEGRLTQIEQEADLTIFWVNHYYEYLGERGER